MLVKKKEELEIQKEMAHIRKEMEIERKKQQEEIAKFVVLIRYIIKKYAFKIKI